MKIRRILFFALLAGLLAVVSCRDSFTETSTYMAYVPQYMTYEELREKLSSTGPTDLNERGKIYIKDQYLFINEKYKGVHVYDNSNPSSPENIAFLPIPGNVDIAVVGDYMYADSYVDMVVLDLSNMNEIKEVGRLKDVMPYTIPETESDYPIAPIDQTKGVITGWKVEEYTQTYEGQYYPGPVVYDKFSGIYSGYSLNESGASVFRAIGVGGSLARFAVVENTLYTINFWEMKLINLSSPTQPVSGKIINLNRMAETAFVDGTTLYIGTQTGMLVYDVHQPTFPVYLSSYDHFQSCDPVVVQNGIAYVTMRAGGWCGNNANQMDVINVTDPVNPLLIKSYPMAEPYGLGIDGNLLFVCDGAAGLKIFDASDPTTISSHLIKVYMNIHATDVIPFNGLLILLTESGIYQYSYTDPDNIVELSYIPVVKG